MIPKISMQQSNNSRPSFGTALHFVKVREIFPNINTGVQQKMPSYMEEQVLDRLLDGDYTLTSLQTRTDYQHFMQFLSSKTPDQVYEVTKIRLGCPSVEKEFRIKSPNEALNMEFDADTESTLQPKYEKVWTSFVDVVKAYLEKLSLKGYLSIDDTTSPLYADGFRRFRSNDFDAIKVNIDTMGDPGSLRKISIRDSKWASDNYVEILKDYPLDESLKPIYQRLFDKFESKLQQSS